MKENDRTLSAGAAGAAATDTPSAGENAASSGAKKKKSFKDHLGTRIIALLLAALMIFSCTSLVTLAQTRREQKQTELAYVGTLMEQASSVTSANTPFLRKGLLEQAWQLLQHAIGRPDSFEDYDTYASLAIARGEYAEAADYMQGCIDTSDGGAEELALLWLRKGSLYTLQSRRDEAIGCYDTALALDGSLQDAYLLRAQMKSENGDASSAADDLRSYEALAGPNPVVQAALGGLYESIEDYATAIECYTAAIDSGHYEAAALASRARCRILSGDTKAAADDLERFFAEGGKDETGDEYAMYGMCLMEHARYDEALEALHAAIRVGYSQKKTMYNQCVICAFAAENYAAVVTDGNAAIELIKAEGGSDAELRELYEMVGFARFIDGDFENAAQNFDDILAIDPAAEYINYYAGISHMSVGHMEKAAEYLTASAERGEYVSVCLYDAALCHIELEDYETARGELRGAIEAADDEEAVREAESMLEELEAYLAELAGS